jgi:hypothetical protein
MQEPCRCALDVQQRSPRAEYVNRPSGTQESNGNAGMMAPVMAPPVQMLQRHRPHPVLSKTYCKDTRSRAATTRSSEARALSAMIDAPPIVMYKDARIGGTSSEEFRPAMEKGSTSYTCRYCIRDDAAPDMCEVVVVVCACRPEARCQLVQGHVNHAASICEGVQLTRCSYVFHALISPENHLERDATVQAINQCATNCTCGGKPHTHRAPGNLLLSW